MLKPYDRQYELTPAEIEALQEISWNYGSGDLVAVIAKGSNERCAGIAVFNLQSGMRAGEFYIDDKRIAHMCGHQKKVKS